MLSDVPAEINRPNLLIEKTLSIYSVEQLFHIAVKRLNHEDNSYKDSTMASQTGNLYFMKKILGAEFPFIEKKTTTTFEIIDVDGTNVIDQYQFESFTCEPQSEPAASGTIGIIRLSLVKTGQQRFDGWSNHRFSNRCSSRGLDRAVKQYLNWGGKFAANNWSMLYCGGNEVVISQLNDYKHTFGINVAVEKLD